MTASFVTNVDALSPILADDVIRLRLWGTDHALLLPREAARATIGASPQCSWQLVDPSRCVSRVHAEVVLENERWTVRDLHSKNGLRFDGVRAAERSLVPGLEIGIGSLVFVAETMRSITLRAYLARLLGWDREALGQVDLALRSIHLAQNGQSALVLCGDDDLIACARTLHHICADAQPFVICDPRGARPPASFKRAVDALEVAAGGTLCLHARRLPPDTVEALARARSPLVRARAVFCGPVPPLLRAQSYACITIPPISSRTADLDRIIDEYAADATAQLGTPVTFTSTDREWVRGRSASSHAEIAKGTRRILAVRIAGSVAGAADLLGMTHGSLGEWLSRRRSPAHFRPRDGSASILDRTSNSSAPDDNANHGARNFE